MNVVKLFETNDKKAFENYSNKLHQLSERYRDVNKATNNIIFRNNNSVVYVASLTDEELFIINNSECPDIIFNDMIEAKIQQAKISL